MHVHNRRSIDLYVCDGSSQAVRERVFLEWCRRELRDRANPMMAKWATEYGTPVPVWGIRLD